jgi:hypothetical protein
MLANADFVKILYKTLLGREADPAGLSHFTSVLDQHADYKGVINSITSSDEFAKQHADDAASESIDIVAELRALRDEIRAGLSIVRTLATDLLLQERSRDPRHVLQAATHIYSQNYEDAIIAEIYSRIGEKSRVFVEVGVETGVECNTRALLEPGWTGIWIDGNARAIEVANLIWRPMFKAER